MSTSVVTTRSCIQDSNPDSSSPAFGKPSMINRIEHLITTRITALSARHEAVLKAGENDVERDDHASCHRFHETLAEKAEIETQIRSKRMLLKLITSQKLSLESPHLQHINWSTQDLLLLLQMNEQISNELESEKADKACLASAVDDVSARLACERAAREEAETRLRQQENEIELLKAQTKQMVVISRQLEDEKLANMKIGSAIDQVSALYQDWSKPKALASYNNSLPVLEQEQFPAAKVEAKNLVLSVICLSVLAVPVLCPVIVLLSPVLAPIVASYLFLKYRLQLSFFSIAFHFQWSMIVPDVYWYVLYYRVH